MLVYRCEKCGACCRRLIIEAFPTDVLRAPEIHEKCRHLNGRNGEIPLLESMWLIACGQTEPCPFHHENECTIYDRRPEVCVAFAPGSPKCGEVREEEGKPPLTPIEILVLTTIQDHIHEAIVNYEKAEMVQQDADNA